MDNALRQRLQAQEGELLQAGTRRDATRLNALLHPDFREFGAAGHVYDRASVIRSLAEESPERLSMAGFEVRELAPGVVLASYRARRERPAEVREALRSSVWVEVGGGWQMRFHQGRVVGRPG